MHHAQRDATGRRGRAVHPPANAHRPLLSEPGVVHDGAVPQPALYGTRPGDGPKGYEGQHDYDITCSGIDVMLCNPYITTSLAPYGPADAL